MYTKRLLFYLPTSLLTFASCHELHQTTTSLSPPNNTSIEIKLATPLFIPQSLSSTSTSAHLTSTFAPQSQHLKANASPISDTTSTVTQIGGTKPGLGEALICYAHPELSTSWCVIHGITVAVPKTTNSRVSASISTVSVSLESNFISSGSDRDFTSTIVEAKTFCSEGEGNCADGMRSTTHISQLTLLGGFNCTTLSNREVQCFRTGSVLDVLAITTSGSESLPSISEVNTTSITAISKSVTQRMNSTTIITTSSTAGMKISNVVVAPTLAPTQSSGTSVVTTSSMAQGENTRSQNLQGVLLIPMLYAAFGI